MTQSNVACGSGTAEPKTIEQLIKSLSLYKADLNNGNIWKGDSGLLAIIETLEQTPPQSPNRAVLDAYATPEMIDVGVDFLLKHREKTSNAVLAEMLFNEMVKAATQADEVKVIDGLEESIIESCGFYGAIDSKKIAGRVIEHLKHLKRQKGR